MSIRYNYERPELRLLSSRNAIRNSMAWTASKLGHRIQDKFTVLLNEYVGKCRVCGATVIYIFQTKAIIGQAVNEKCVKPRR